MTDENLPLGPKKLNEKYRDRGHVEEWAVQPAAAPCVGNLATPVNSGYFVKALVNNLPLYREGISANFRGLETGAAIGYFIYGPFLVMGPLRTTDFATTAVLIFGFHATVGQVTNLVNIYKEHSIHPKDLQKIAEKNPEVKDQLNRGEKPEFIDAHQNALYKNAEKIKDIKLLPEPKFKLNEKLITIQYKHKIKYVGF